MTIKELIKYGQGQLAKEKIENGDRDALVLLAFALQCSQVDLVTHPEKLVDVEIIGAYENLIEKRCARMPVAYLVGHKEFYGLSLEVNPKVLIPRPETEMLVDWLIERNKKSGIEKLLDVGTGSGAIAIAAKVLMPEVDVTAMDIDKEALGTAMRNAEQHQAQITWQLSDLLQKVSCRFDVIVSNLPYIDPAVIATLSDEVLQEPIGALDGGKDGMELITRLLSEAKAHLAPGGVLLLEIGHDQKQAIVLSAQENGYTTVDVRPDLQGCDRMVIIEE